MQSHRNDLEQPTPLKNLASNDPFLEALTELLPVCLFAKDMDGRYLYVNDSFAAKTRLRDKALIVGKRASDVLEPDHAAIAQKEDQEILESGQAILNRENHVRGLAQTENCEIISKVCVYIQRASSWALLASHSTLPSASVTKPGSASSTNNSTCKISVTKKNSPLLDRCKKPSSK